MKNRILALVFTLCLALSLAACSSGGSSAQPSQAAESPAESAPPVEEAETLEPTPTPEPTPTLSTTLEEQVLYEDNGIAIRATGISLDETGPYEIITLALENDTSEEVDFISGVGAEVCVNGYMISDAMGGIWETVPAGETAEAQFVFFPSQLERYGIEEIGELSFDMYTGVGDPGILTVRTSAAGSYERLCDSSGQTVYEDERYKVVYQGPYQGPVYDGLTFYLENNTDETRSFFTSLTVNGEEGAAFEGIDLYPHTAALLDVEFFSATLDEVETVSVEYFSIELPGGDDRIFTPEAALDLGK